MKFCCVPKFILLGLGHVLLVVSLLWLFARCLGGCCVLFLCLPCCNFIPLEVGFSIFFLSFPLNDALKQIGFTFYRKSHPLYLGGLVNIFTRFKARLIVSLEYCFLNNFKHSITHSISHIYNNSTKCVEFMNIVI